MPTLFILNGWKIQMFARENEEPHFHVSRDGVGFRFGLADFDQLGTDILPAPAGLARKVREWAGRNQRALNAVWAAIRSGGVPDKSRKVASSIEIGRAQR